MFGQSLFHVVANNTITMRNFVAQQQGEDKEEDNKRSDQDIQIDQPVYDVSDISDVNPLTLAPGALPGLVSDLQLMIKNQKNSIKQQEEQATRTDLFADHVVKQNRMMSSCLEKTHKRMMDYGMVIEKECMVYQKKCLQSKEKCQELKNQILTLTEEVKTLNELSEQRKQAYFNVVAKLCSRSPIFSEILDAVDEVKEGRRNWEMGKRDALTYFRKILERMSSSVDETLKAQLRGLIDDVMVNAEECMYSDDLHSGLAGKVKNASWYNGALDKDAWHRTEERVRDGKAKPILQTPDFKDKIEPVIDETGPLADLLDMMKLRKILLDEDSLSKKQDGSSSDVKSEDNINTHEVSYYTADGIKITIAASDEAAKSCDAMWKNEDPVISVNSRPEEMDVETHMDDQLEPNVVGKANGNIPVPDLPCQHSPHEDTKLCSRQQDRKPKTQEYEEALKVSDRKPPIYSQKQDKDNCKNSEMKDSVPPLTNSACEQEVQGQGCLVSQTILTTIKDMFHVSDSVSSGRSLPKFPSITSPPSPISLVSNDSLFISCDDKLIEARRGRPQRYELGRHHSHSEEVIQSRSRSPLRKVRSQDDVRRSRSVSPITTVLKPSLPDLAMSSSCNTEKSSESALSSDSLDSCNETSDAETLAIASRTSVSENASRAREMKKSPGNGEIHGHTQHTLPLSSANWSDLVGEARAALDTKFSLTSDTDFSINAGLSPDSPKLSTDKIGKETVDHVSGSVSEDEQVVGHCHSNENEKNATFVVTTSSCGDVDLPILKSTESTESIQTTCSNVGVCQFTALHSDDCAVFVGEQPEAEVCPDEPFNSFTPQTENLQDWQPENHMQEKDGQFQDDRKECGVEMSREFVSPVEFLNNLVETSTPDDKDVHEADGDLGQNSSEQRRVEILNTCTNVASDCALTESEINISSECKEMSDAATHLIGTQTEAERKFNNKMTPQSPATCHSGDCIPETDATAAVNSLNSNSNNTTFIVSKETEVPQKGKKDKEKGNLAEGKQTQGERGVGLKRAAILKKKGKTQRQLGRFRSPRSPVCSAPKQKANSNCGRYPVSSKKENLEGHDDRTRSPRAPPSRQETSTPVSVKRLNRRISKVESSPKVMPVLSKTPTGTTKKTVDPTKHVLAERWGYSTESDMSSASHGEYLVSSASPTPRTGHLLIGKGKNELTGDMSVGPKEKWIIGVAVGHDNENTGSNLLTIHRRGLLPDDERMDAATSKIVGYSPGQKRKIAHAGIKKRTLVSKQDVPSAAELDHGNRISDTVNKKIESVLRKGETRCGRKVLDGKTQRKDTGQNGGGGNVRKIGEGKRFASSSSKKKSLIGMSKSSEHDSPKLYKKKEKEIGSEMESGGLDLNNNLMDNEMEGNLNDGAIAGPSPEKTVEVAHGPMKLVHHKMESDENVPGNERNRTESSPEKMHSLPEVVRSVARTYAKSCCPLALLPKRKIAASEAQIDGSPIINKDVPLSRDNEVFHELEPKQNVKASGSLNSCHTGIRGLRASQGRPTTTFSESKIPLSHTLSDGSIAPLSIRATDIPCHVDAIMASKSASGRLSRGTGSESQLCLEEVVSLQQLDSKDQHGLVEGTVARSNTPTSGGRYQYSQRNVPSIRPQRRISLPQIHSSDSEAHKSTRPMTPRLRYKKSEFPKLPNIAPDK